MFPSKLLNPRKSCLGIGYLLPNSGTRYKHKVNEASTKMTYIHTRALYGVLRGLYAHKRLSTLHDRELDTAVYGLDIIDPIDMPMLLSHLAVQ